MTVPTISNLPTVPATSDPNFETEAPALFNHIKNTFVSEMNSAISFINSSTFDATVEFKNGNFTAARNFLYMIDTSSGGVSVTLPANPSTGDQLLLMDQKRTFGTNNLTIVRNGQNINGAASDVVSKSTGALIRCIFQSSYGWTVDLYEGEWESGTSAGDLVYTGGNVGIGTSSPSGRLDVNTGVMSGDVKIGNFDNVVNGNNTSQLGNGTKLEFIADTNPRYSNHDPYTVAYVKAEYDSTGADTKTGDTALTFATYDGYRGATNGVLSEKMRISSDGKVGIGTSAPKSELHIKAKSNRTPTSLAPNELDNNSVFRVGMDTGDSSIYFAYGNAGDAIMQIANSSGGTAQDLFINPFGGKVGIGTSAPSHHLDVSGSGSGIYSANFTNTHGNGNGVLINAGALDTNFPLRVRNSSSTDLLSVRANGNVGIGTSAPSGDLHVESSNPSTAQIIMKSTATGGKEYHLNCTANSSSIGGGNLAIRDYTANAYRLIVKTGGDVEVSTGNLVIGTAGKGIDFSASSHFGGTGGGTGMSSELLTDYEEGSWSPVVADASSGGNTATGNFSGTYTKVGRIVTVHCYALDINTTGLTSTNSIVVRGLPFTNGDTIAKYGSIRLQSVTFLGYCVAQLGGSSSSVLIIENKSGISNSNVTVGALNSGVADILFSLTYQS